MRKNLLSNCCLTFVTAAICAFSASALQTQPDSRLHRQHQWRNGSRPTMMRNYQMRNSASKLVDHGTPVSDKCDFYGVLNLPDGSNWYYNADYTYDESGFSIQQATFHIFDQDAKPQGSFTCELTLGENETGVNWVELSPTVTRKFFNTDDKNEYIVFVHATTKDYQGHCYSRVYQADGTAPVMSIEGNHVMSVNTAQDSYSENFTLVFERENPYNEEGSEILYDIYTKASYSTQNNLAECAHTFAVPLRYVTGTDYFMPFLMNKKGKDVYYLLPHYAKEYFDPSIPYNEDPVVQPDNSLVIDLYDKDFNLVKSTNIPIETRPGYIYTMPQMGDLMYQNDISWNFFKPGDEPTYVITFANYVNSSDTFVTDYEVYDWDGNKLQSLGSEISDRMQMSDAADEPTQFCFIVEDPALGLCYRFVDIPSGEVRATIPAVWEDNLLSTSLDRVNTKEGPEYVFSLAQGEYTDDTQTDVAHGFAWFDSEGNFTRRENINMGSGIYLVNPYVSGPALDRFFYDTDEKMAYMMLVKYNPTGESGGMMEQLRITDIDGNKLLEFGPRNILDEDGKETSKETIASVNIINAKTNPVLLISYRDDNWKYYTEYLPLPLTAFAQGGDGSAENPYLVSTYGDLRKMGRNPGLNYRLANDIDATGYVYTPVSTEFTGSLDGAGHVISNLSIQGEGLFTYATGESTFVKDLILNYPELTPGSDDSGFICGMSVNGPKFENIRLLNPEVDAPDFDSAFGSIVGRATTKTIISGCGVTNADYNLPKAIVGGIVGGVRTGSQVNACQFNGTVNALNAGGIVGESTSGDEKITNCHVDADIAGSSSIGGIMGNGARTSISNCYVEGTLSASYAKDPAVGGIVGFLNPAVKPESSPIVSNNIVALSSIEFPEDAAKITAHRIVGHSSIDEEGEIDWESDYWDNDPDYNNSSEWPRLPSEPEKGLSGNYATGIALIDGEDDTTSTEGKSVEAIDSDLLSTLGFAMGESNDAPWQYTADLNLYYEDAHYAVLAMYPTLSLTDDETAEISFQLVGGEASELTITSSDPETVAILSIENEGSIANVTVQALKSGNATITAECGNLKAETVITGTSGIQSIVTERNTLSISYANGLVSAQGAQLRIFTLDGTQVARGDNALSVKRLNPGIYLVEATDATGRITRKIAVK